MTTLSPETTSATTDHTPAQDATRTATATAVPTVIVDADACDDTIGLLIDTLATRDRTGPVGEELAEKYTQIARDARAIARLAQAMSVREQQRPPWHSTPELRTPEEVRAAVRIILADGAEETEMLLSGDGLIAIAFELYESVTQQDFPDCDPISRESADEMFVLQRRAAALAVATRSATLYLGQRARGLEQALEDTEPL